MDLNILLLNSNIVMIYLFHKILVLQKNYLDYLKVNIYKCFFKKYDILLLSLVLVLLLSLLLLLLLLLFS